MTARWPNSARCVIQFDVRARRNIKGWCGCPDPDRIVQRFGQDELIMPDTITYSRLRSELAKALNRVTEDHAPLLIVRQRGKPAVLLSAEDYSALEETAYLLRSPKNATRLRAAHEEIEKEIARRAAARRARRTRRR